MDKEQIKSNPQMDAGRKKLTEQVNNAWTFTVEAGLTRSQITHPDFFAHVASDLRPYDEIKVRCDDGTIYARLLVLDTARTYARVHVLEWADLTTKDVAQSQGAKQEPSKDDLKAYTVVNKGPHLKWVVVRNSDGAKLREHEESKQAAQTWLDDYVRITAA